MPFNVGLIIAKPKNKHKQFIMKQVFFAYLLLTSILFLSFNTNLDNNIPLELTQALKVGNARIMSKYLNNSIELGVLENEEVYSKAQAEQILKDFFFKYKPENFEILHQSGKEDSKYVIGRLITQNGNFRIYFLLKNKGGSFLIHQLRIEKDNNER